MQIAEPVFDVQPRAIVGWSLESPVIGNGHAGLYVQRTIMLNRAVVNPLSACSERYQLVGYST